MIEHISAQQVTEHQEKDQFNAAVQGQGKQPVAAFLQLKLAE